MNEIETLLKIWPLLIAVGALMIAVAINSFKRKELEGKQVEFMTKESHELKCSIAGHEIKDFFRAELNSFSEKLILKMCEKDRPFLDLIKRDTDMIDLLDRRTKHLKDSDG